MQKHSDEALVAYLDGELDEVERRHVEAWLDADPAVRERLDALGQSAALLREAYAEFHDAPVPEALIAAARGAAAAAGPGGQEAEIVLWQRPGRGGASPRRRWTIVNLAAAAGIAGLILGAGGTYLGIGLGTSGQPAAQQQASAKAATNNWLDNAAGYYKLMASAGDNMTLDVPASNDSREALQKISQSLATQMRLPDLKPWGLTFRGARLVVVDGRPAAQLVYVTDNKAIGPLSLVIGSSKEPNIAPTFDHRQDVNLLYWRHQGHAYALVGKTDIGWLWGIANDVAWQLDAI